jgi:hypothetical protein
LKQNFTGNYYITGYETNKSGQSTLIITVSFLSDWGKKLNLFISVSIIKEFRFEIMSYNEDWKI